MNTPPDRLIKLCDFEPHSAAKCSTSITILPGGFVLMDPTPTEARMVEIYAEEYLRTHPDVIIAECQQPVVAPPSCCAEWERSAKRPFPNEVVFRGNQRIEKSGPFRFCPWCGVARPDTDLAAKNLKSKP